MNDDNKELLMIVGRRIRYLRKQKGMSILDLSIEADINRNYLSDLERGKRNPTITILSKISIALDVSLSFLLEGVDFY
ncbi:MAG: helix-turn-helix domain-containing protein [Coprobacillus sp.]|nr:helix-turn-helix domain-containing protein [Coprobacillus sp.]